MLEKPSSDFEIQMYSETKNRVHLYSRFEFLRNHFGIRPFTLHGLIACTGSGKSTLIKCIAAEVARQTKVLIWLSEESKVEYQEMLNYLDKDCVKNITFVDEKKIPKEYKASQELFFEYFEQMFEESGAGIVLIDNVTTSAFYGQTFGFAGQENSADFLQNFAKTKGSIFYVSHTGTHVTENYGKVVNPEDIRGNKKLAHLTEYCYTVQKFVSSGKQYNVLRVAKSRHHKKALGWYALSFEKDSYTSGDMIPFSIVNKIFQTRDYFGKKLPKKTD